MTLTIDDELDLIKRRKTPAQLDAEAGLPAMVPPAPQPPAPTPKTPEQIDAELGLPPAQTGLAPLPATDAGTWDILGAAWRAETVRTDAWNDSAVRRRDLTETLWNKLPEDARAAVNEAWRKGYAAGGWPKMQDLILAEAGRVAAASPEAAADWAGLPLSIDAFNQQIDAGRRADLDEAQAILDQPGGAVSEFIGTAARAMTDETSMLLLPFGITGSAWRTIASEAVLGAVGEAAVLPKEFRVARELDLPEPDPVSRIALGAVMGGGFAGALIGLGKGYRALQTRLDARKASLSETLPDGTPRVEHEAAVDAAEAELRGDQTVQERLGGGARAEAPPGTLGDIVGDSAPLELPPGNVPYNEAAVLRAIIGAESGGQANAQNPNSSARGLGQFISGTWLKMIRKHRPDLAEKLSDNELLALRDDPALNAQMTALYTRENHALLTAQGLPADPGSLYLAHFMGPGGAIAALRATPDTPISAIMSRKAIAANAGIRFNGKSFANFTVGDLRAWSARKMKSAYDPNASTDMPSFSTTSRGYTGSGQVSTADGEFRLDVDWEVVDASTLFRASGDMQPRDRSRIASDAWIADTAARLDPAQLMPSPTADRGAPIVGPDGMIESGNGRFGAIERAYERFPDRAAAYRSAIEEAGFAIPEGAERPVLIARRRTELTPEDRTRFAVAAQDSGVAVMTPTEMARASSRAMTSPVLARLDPAAPLRDAANGDFVRAALAGLPRSARNAMFDASGLLNAAGERQLREAIFARAWPDPDLLARFTETDAGELKSLMEALDRAAPAWAALKADIEAGLVRPEMDISPFVLDAMRLIGNARDLAKKQGMPIANALAELLDEVDLLSGALSPLTTALVRKFWTNGRAAKADDVAAFLTRYADDARKAGATGSLFDAPTPQEVLRTIDPETFADLPEDIGQARGFATRASTEARPETVTDLPGTGFDQGARSPEAEATHAEIEADLRGPEPEAQAMAAEPTYYQRKAVSEAVVLAERNGTTIRSYGVVGTDEPFEYHEVELPSGQRLVVGVEKRGPVLRVINIENPAAGLGAEAFNSLGPAALRGVLAAYRQLDPEIRAISGERIGGARRGGGWSMQAGTEVTVPLRADTPPAPAARTERAVADPATTRADQVTTAARSFPAGLRQPSEKLTRLLEMPDGVSTLLESMTSAERTWLRKAYDAGLLEKRPAGLGSHVRYRFNVPGSDANWMRADTPPAPAARAEGAATDPGAIPVAEMDSAAVRPSDAAPDPIAATRADLGAFAEVEIDLPDGTTARAGDLLDDLEADRQFDAFLQACATTPTGAAQ